MFTDCHCHVLTNYYNKDDILNNLEKSNMKRIIANGYDFSSNNDVLNIVEKDNIYGAIGIHPDNISDFENVRKQIIENILREKIIAIGEIGLDYYHNSNNKEEQIKIFEEMLCIAEAKSLPVIIHSRNSSQDVIRILKRYHVKGIIHAFSGSLEEANEYIKLGFKLGIGGVLTFKNSKLSEVLKKIDIKNILIETDSPYLTPDPLRGLINEPANVIFVARKLSEIYNVSIEKIAEQLEENFNDIFDL